MKMACGLLPSPGDHLSRAVAFVAAALVTLTLYGGVAAPFASGADAQADPRAADRGRTGFPGVRAVTVKHPLQR
jgi:hypothetical protein